MPRAKKVSTKKVSKVKKAHKKAADMHEMIDTTTENLLGAPESTYSQATTTTSMKRWGMLVAILAVAVLAYMGTKGYIVAALVNGNPVFRWEVSRELDAKFGAQIIENMISEKLIAEAAMKNKVVISDKDVESKLNEIVTSLGANVKLDDLLKYQGMTKEDFQHQIRLQMTVEKILGKDVTVSDAEIADFITKNKETMTATDEAALNGEARASLTSQKINEKIQPWFAQLKKDAKIVKLMK